MSDTIDEQDAFGITDPPPPRRESTGRHRSAADRAELEELISQAIAKRAPSQVKAIAAIVIAALTASGGTYGAQAILSAQEEGRDRARIEALERDVATNRRQLEGVGAISRDIAALGARVDGINAAVAAGSSSTNTRLDRIEDRLERLRR